MILLILAGPRVTTPERHEVAPSSAASFQAHGFRRAATYRITSCEDVAS